MHITRLISFALASLVSCSPEENSENHGASDAGSLIFVTPSVQSPSLRIKPTLRCFPGKQLLEMTLRLESLIPEKITVTEMVLNNSSGLRSLADQSLSLLSGGDTTVSVVFNHINDNELFHATGLHGPIDSVYNIAVFYTVEGREGVRVINLVSKMPEETFVSYTNAYDTPVAIYGFNRGSGFDEKQRQFLLTNRIVSTSPFVHITEQELALCGLNFRMKCFHKKDSLFAEVFVVNHSDITVRIDTSKIDIIFEGAPHELRGEYVRIKKVTGSRDDLAVLRKGDRAVITMRRLTQRSPEKLSLAFADAFFLSSEQPLFSDNLELIRQD